MRRGQDAEGPLEFALQGRIEETHGETWSSGIACRPVAVMRLRISTSMTWSLPVGSLLDFHADDGAA